jgi:copper(I)-binding protein
MNTKQLVRIGLLALTAIALLSACGGAAAPAANPTNPPPMGLTITEVWARAAVMTTSGMQTPSSGGMEMSKPTSAVYMKISGGGMADKLVKAETTVAESTELHTVKMKDGVMQMRPVEGGIDVPADGTVELKPGGFHVMLIGLTQDLKPGETFTVKLTFEKAGVKEVPVEIRSVQQ